VNTKKTMVGIALGLSLALASATSGAAVFLFDTLGGPTYEIDYGAAGVASVSASYIGPFGTQTPDVVDASVAGLSFTSSVSGDGTGLFAIEYQLENTSVGDSFNLGFIVRVDPDGDGFFTEDTGSSSFGSVAVGEPSDWEIDSSSGNIDQNIAAGQLDNSNNCDPEGCDLIYALQWQLGLLAPGDIAIVTVGLSDDGQALSANYLDADALSRSSSLRLSGTTVVPVPAALPLFLSAIFCLVTLTRRKL
jgi:hypothetical protein